MRLAVTSLALIALLTTALQASTASAPTTAAATVAMSLAVDATEFPRRILKSTLELAARPPALVVRYPEWIPGTHAPTRQLSNLAGFEATDTSGRPLRWVRDAVDRHDFRIDVPKGVSRVRIHLRYICNQPNENSDGVDCFGNPHMGILNWNAVTVYPAGVPAASVSATVSLTLPAGWAYGTAMRTESRQGDRVQFKATDFETLLDRPLICGQYLKSVVLPAKNAPPHRMHLVSDIETSVTLEPEVKDSLTALVEEAGAYLGGFPYDSYDFLIVLTESFPRIGLEHTDSHISCTSEESLVDEKVRKRDFDYLVAHEFAHAWCGKYRRPRAMIVPDFNTPEQTELLWVYEGLTQFLSWVLPIRCGLQTEEEFLQIFAWGVEKMMAQRGRTWRPLEDTATASYLLRGRSQAWNNWRRGQDYYQEGALLWMEIDSIIRSETLGEKTLRDFLKAFFARKPARETTPGSRVVGFDLDEIVSELNKVVPKDWAAFLEQRTRQTQDELPVTFIQKAGYRLVYEPKRSDFLKDIERTWGKKGWVDLTGSLGFTVGENGNIGSVVPGRPADRAGLYDSATIVAVDGRAFSGKRINDAVERSVSTRAVELLVQEGDLFRTVKIPYADGPRFLQVQRDEAYPDLIGKLLAPLREGAKPPEKKKDDNGQDGSGGKGKKRK